MRVPDSKPPYLLLGAGAVLLAVLVIRTLRRRQRRASAPSRDAIVLRTWKTETPPAVHAPRERQARPRGATATRPGRTARPAA